METEISITIDELQKAAELLERHEDQELAGNIYFHLMKKAERSLIPETQFEFACKCVSATSRPEYQTEAAKQIFRLAAPIGQHREAVRILEENLHKFRNKADLLSAMATLSLQLGDAPEARILIDKALELDSNHTGARRLFELLSSS